MTRPELIALAKETALRHNLDPALVCAVAHHESGNWKPWAIRYEPGFYRRYVASMKLQETEKMARSTSWGLMQIMGQVAREFGFRGKYLSELLDPAVNLEYGCRKLAQCMAKAGGNRRTALLKYNGGSNAGYPDLVLRHAKEYQ